MVKYMIANAFALTQMIELYVYAPYTTGVNKLAFKLATTLEALICIVTLSVLELLKPQDVFHVLLISMAITYYAADTVYEWNIWKLLQ